MNWISLKRTLRDLPLFVSRKTTWLAAFLLCLTLLFLAMLVSAWQTQLRSPITCQVSFAPLKEHNGYVELQVKKQHPVEPTFEADIFVLLKEGEHDSNDLQANLDITQSATGGYGSSIYRLEMISDPTSPGSRSWRSRDFKVFSLVSKGRVHRWFPFDEGEFDFTLRFQPRVSPPFVRIVNRVPGFDLTCADLKATRPNDSYRIAFRLTRSFLIPFAAIVLGLCSVVFLLLVPRLQKVETVATAATSYFFSLWSMRQIMASQIGVFPTLFDCAILTLCILMTVSLVWRAAYHWMNQEKERLISIPAPSIKDPPALFGSNPRGTHKK